MDYKESDEEHKEVNEPQPTYSSFAGKKVRFFNSFKEQEDEMIAYWASITPLQRLTNLHEMIQISYKLTKDKPVKSSTPKKITIIKYEPNTPI